MRNIYTTLKLLKKISSNLINLLAGIPKLQISLFAVTTMTIQEVSHAKTFFCVPNIVKTWSKPNQTFRQKLVGKKFFGQNWQNFGTVKFFLQIFLSDNFFCNTILFLGYSVWVLCWYQTKSMGIMGRQAEKWMALLGKVCIKSCYRNSFQLYLSVFIYLKVFVLGGTGKLIFLAFLLDLYFW